MNHNKFVKTDYVTTNCNDVAGRKIAVSRLSVVCFVVIIFAFTAINF